MFITDDLGTDGWGASPLHILARAQHGYPQTINSTHSDKQSIKAKYFSHGILRPVSFFYTSFGHGSSAVGRDPVSALQL